MLTEFFCSDRRNIQISIINLFMYHLLLKIKVKRSEFTDTILLIPIPLSQIIIVVVAQSLSCVWLFSTPWTTTGQTSLSFTITQSLLKLMSTESMILSNHLIFCCPLLLPSIFSSIRVFSNEKLFISGSQILELQLQHKSFQRIFKVDFI